MPSMLFLIVVVVVCLPLVWFGLSNAEVVTLGLWPTDYHFDVPLSIAILVSMAFAFLAGGLVVWVSEVTQRMRARRAEHRVRLLEAQIEALRPRIAAPASPMSPASPTLLPPVP